VDIAAGNIMREVLSGSKGIQSSNIGDVKRIPVWDLHAVLGMELGVGARKIELREWVVTARERGMRKEMGHVLWASG
jgi:hypothetical protein